MSELPSFHTTQALLSEHEPPETHPPAREKPDCTAPRERLLNGARTP